MRLNRISKPADENGSSRLSQLIVSNLNTCKLYERNHQ